MSVKKLLPEIYQSAKDFLIFQLDSIGKADILTSYLDVLDTSLSPKSLNQLYAGILQSAQNANMKAGVIGGALGGVEHLGRITDNFNPAYVTDTFKGSSEMLLNTIIDELKPRGQIRRESRSIWPKYCRTMLSAAVFLQQFADGADFYDWANHFYQDSRSMAALPLILTEEIDGFGYALACDFLKELGFVQYGKPDVHIIEIFSAIGLCAKKASLYQIQKVISDMAHAVDVSPYNVDKLFWLIGSGRFYHHPEIKLGRMKQKFIDIFLSII